MLVQVENWIPRDGQKVAVREWEIANSCKYLRARARTRAQKRTSGEAVQDVADSNQDTDCRLRPCQRSSR